MKEAPQKTPGRKANRTGSATTSKKGNNSAPFGTETAKKQQAHVHHPQATRLSSGAKKQGGN